MTVEGYLAQDIGSIVVQLARLRAENDLLRAVIAEKDAALKESNDKNIELRSSLEIASSIIEKNTEPYSNV